MLCLFQIAKYKCELATFNKELSFCESVSLNISFDGEKVGRLQNTKKCAKKERKEEKLVFHL